MSARRVAACVVVGYALLVCALWHRTIFGGQIGGWDCVLEYWPDLEFQVRSIGHHTLPLWCPWSLGGYPFSADLQSGFYSPVNWICIAFGLAFGAGAWLIQLKVMLTMVVGLCGMHALIWHRTRSHAAGFVAAVTYVVGSPLLVHKNGAFLWPLLYLPWAVLALSRLCDAPSLRRGALLGLAIWLCGSAGHPQAFFYDLLVIGAYALVRVRSRAQLPALAIAAGVAVLTLLVIYVPALDAVAISGRATRDASYVLDNALPARELLELVIPNLDSNWQLDIYVGPLAIVGAIWALIVAPRATRRELVFWVAVAIVGVLLAMGRQGHLLALCYRFVPGFTLFRIAYRFKAIFGFAAALLAGEGVAAATRCNLRVAASIAGVWLVAGLAIARTPYSITQAVILAVALMPAKPRVRGILLGAVVVVDLWAAGASKLAIVQPRPDPRAHADIVAQMPGAADRWRYHVDDVALPYGGTLPYEAAYHYAIRELSGYGNPIASARVLAAETAAQHDPQLLAHFGVKYFLGGHLRPSNARAVPALRGFELLDDDVAAIATLYPTAERVTERGALDRLRQTTPSKLDHALVEADAPLALPVSQFAPIAGVVASYAPGAIALDVSAPAAGVLVVAESWAPGWSATVDGDDAPVIRANYLSMGVIVPSGAHRVRLEFTPHGYALLLALFAGGLAGGLVLVTRTARRARPVDAPVA
ncbi:MAG TPA: hypothetical protein VH143_06715 [Kofleriaceae bacterium]|jgi:hypothetical protein|nr:hypothetical protein [Kofleriaceae bacterium]